MSSLTDLAGDGISHFDLLGVDSSSSQLLREGVLISDTNITIVYKSRNLYYQTMVNKW